MVRQSIAPAPLSPDRYAFTMRQTGPMVTATLALRGEPCSA